MANEINMNLEEFQQRERAASLMADELATLREEKAELLNAIADHQTVRSELRAENERLKADVAHWRYEADEAGTTRVLYGKQIDELKRQRDEFQWKPIETHPDDSTKILVFSPKFGVWETIGKYAMQPRGNSGWTPIAWKLSVQSSDEVLSAIKGANGS